MDRVRAGAFRAARAHRPGADRASPVGNATVVTGAGEGLRLGELERRALAAELVLGGHRHRVPAPFETGPGRRVRMKVGHDV